MNSKDIYEATRAGDTGAVIRLLSLVSSSAATAIATASEIASNAEEAMRLALGWAARTGHVDTVKALLDSGADVNAKDGIAVVCAIEGGQVDVVKLFLERGAKLDSQATIFIRPNDIHMLEFLLENGADVNAANSNGTTLLMKASKYGFSKTVQILMQHNADIHMRDNVGFSAIDWAVYKKRTDIIRDLQSHV